MAFATIHKTVSLLIFLMVTCLSGVFAQITIRVIQVPKNTSPKDSIFLAGSFNNWMTKDLAMRLIPQPDGTYTVTFLPPGNFFEYKFTKGDWSSVEGDKDGKTIPNRNASYNGKPLTVDVSIETWMDFETIRVIHLPLNTPDDASIYLTGPFNYWNPADPNYKLERLANGIYQYILLHRDSISFKFTRGTLNSIETNVKGKPIAARVLVASKLESKTTEYVIESWEDLSENQINSFESILMWAAFTGFFFSFGLYFIKHAKKETNNLISLVLILISTVLFVWIFLQYEQFYHRVPQLVLLPLFLLFAVSPLLYVYSKSILLYYEGISIKDHFIFFIPLLILLMGFLPFLIADKNHFITLLLNHQTDNNFKIVVGVGILFNGYYLFNLFHLLKSARQIADVAPIQKTYKRYVFFLLLISSLIVGLLVIGFLISFQSGESWRSSVDVIINLCWFALCLYPFTVAWFVIVHPEIFSLGFELDKGKSKDTLVVLKTKLDGLMENKRPYLDPELGLNDLAGLLQTTPQLLSRLINEDSEMNFYDFINGYRIGEFKKRCEAGQHKNMTIIAIANDVGFKSKTTFNRTFKKLNGVTPRDYLNTLDGDS